MMNPSPTKSLPAVETKQEKRRAPRLNKNIPVKICQEGGDTVTETLNISRSGVLCRVEKYIEVMTKLKIQLLLSFMKNGKTATKRISCSGVVIRSETMQNKKGCQVAVFFNDIAEKEAAAISEYVNLHSLR